MVVGDVEVFQQLPPRRLVGAGDVVMPLLLRLLLPLRCLVDAGDVAIPLLRPVLPPPWRLVGAGDIVMPLLLRLLLPPRCLVDAGDVAIPLVRLLRFNVSVMISHADSLIIIKINDYCPK